MAVAVKTSPETTPRSPVTHLAVNSLLGALYLLFAVGTVLTGLPVLWNEALEINKHVNEFLSGALLLMAELGAIVGLFVLGRVLEGPHPQRGQRAGTFVAAAGLCLIGLITLNVGTWM